jgi:hypothetical protein
MPKVTSELPATIWISHLQPILTIKLAYYFLVQVSSLHAISDITTFKCGSFQYNKQCNLRFCSLQL